MHASAKRAHGRMRAASARREAILRKVSEGRNSHSSVSWVRLRDDRQRTSIRRVKDIAASRAWSSEMMSEPVKKSRLRSSGTRGWPTSCWRTCSARDRQSAWQIASTARLQRFALVGVCGTYTLGSSTSLICSL